MNYKIFISHSGADTWVAKQIEIHLKKRGATTFIDAADIQFGDQFEERIFQEMKKCNELLVLLTPWSLNRPYIYMEIGAARMMEMRIIIILLGLTTAEIIINPTIPQTIKGNNIISINDLDEYFGQVENRVNLSNNNDL